MKFKDVYKSDWLHYINFFFTHINSYAFFGMDDIQENVKCKSYISLVTFIKVTMPFHNREYIMGYNIMAQTNGLTRSL